nr:YraN family protein [uncultured Gellertiella sp.]
MPAEVSPARRRKKAERRGRWSEWMAALWLLAHGYRIVALRHRTPLGEIDIIARRGTLVLIVEVKARREPGAALDAVSAAAQRRIRAASDLWLSRQPDAHLLSLRYDIIAIVPGRWPQHLADAF